MLHEILPTIDEVGLWIKANKFEIVTGRFGNMFCGCLLTAIERMLAEKFPKKAVYNNSCKIVDLMKIIGDNKFKSIYHGFDQIPRDTETDDDEYYNYGLDGRRLLRLTEQPFQG